MVEYRLREPRGDEPSPREKLEAVCRTFRVPEGFTLEALFGDLVEGECRERGRCFPPEKVVEDAIGVYLKAFDALRRAGDAQRAAIRGCTLELLVLCAEQALTLARRLDARTKAREARAAAITAHQARLQELFARALTLREQARRVLSAMGRADVAYQDAVLRAATGADAGGGAAAAMLALADLGAKLLRESDPRISQRARLLGLDAAYVQEIEALGRALRDGEAELGRLLADGSEGDDVLSVQAGVTLHLMVHVVSAFEAAHEIERSVAVLRPVHTQRVIRPLSKLPAPPAPVPGTLAVGERASSAQGQAKVPAAPVPEFHGGLGRGRR